MLIDLRPAEAAGKGFIPGAVSIPANELLSAKDKFPSDMSAPIILYSSLNATEDAFRTVRGWGYKEVSVLSGGFAAWEKIGGTIATGELRSSISYVPKPRPGEVAIEEFKEYVEKGDPSVFLLDVRDSDEAMHGMLKGAMNIPVSQLEERAKELPKDKLIIAHCVTGIRAESAYDQLKELGFKKVKFLNAVIQIDRDGKYEITKK